MSLSFLRGGIFFVIVFLGAPVQAFNIDLAPEEWYLLSVPGEQTESIAALFNDDLEEADYNTTWTVYSYDKSIQDYKQLSATDVLGTGEAFWFVHYSGSSISFEVSEDFLEAPMVVSSACPSEAGCFEYDLPTGSDVSWSMIGSPFLESVYIDEIRLVTSSGVCQAGCTINEASDAGLSGNAFFLYSTEETAYDPLVDDELMMAGEGHWFPSTIPDELQPARLLIPNFCNT